jgi:hypothetical protein
MPHRLRLRHRRDPPQPGRLHSGIQHPLFQGYAIQSQCSYVAFTPNRPFPRPLAGPAGIRHQTDRCSVGCRRTGTVTYYVYQSCAGFLINNTADSLAVYDFWDYGGSTQWLNGNCIVQKQATIGTCIFSDTFGPSFQSSVYIRFVCPSPFFPPLTDETRPALSL